MKSDDEFPSWIKQKRLKKKAKNTTKTTILHNKIANFSNQHT